MNQQWTANSSLNTFENKSKSNSSFLFSTPFNVEAKTFTPKTFNPFPTKKEINDDDDDILNELNDQFIASHLLEEEDEDVKKDTQAFSSLSAGVWNEPKEWASPELKHIWDNGLSSTKPLLATSSAVPDTTPTTPPFSYSRDDQEFDPTLQFFNGNLYDADTIQDMNRLSLSVTNPSIEEVEKEDVEQDMSTLQMLQTIFSDLNEAELVETLEMYDYDADAAIEYLLAKNAVIPQPTPLPSIVQEEPVVKKRQVCRHFLAGECYRKDCWFSHDLQDKICKFWLQGSCFKGDLCEFSHTIDIQEVVANKMSSTNTTAETTKTNIPSDNDYPALSSTYAKKDPTTTTTTTATIQEDFPSLAMAASIKTPPTQSKQKTINFAEIAKKKKGDATTPLASKKPSVNHVKRHYQYTYKELSEPVQIPWLETGSPLNTIYMKEREKAIEYGMLRNRFFSKATEYYLKGDGARAKMYSMEAKQYNRLMQEMHKEASQRIFEQRSKHEAFIDLHGLHQEEAMDIIKERLEYLKSTYSGIIYIVTGTGHHSGSNGLSKRQSKLKPIVQQYLKQHNYRFAETNVLGDNQGGIFAVEI